VNNFIPYTETEVNAPDRFESDFMVRYLDKKKLSKEAKAVLNAGRELLSEKLQPQVFELGFLRA
jgi:hypothetical protein